MDGHFSPGYMYGQDGAQSHARPQQSGPPPQSHALGSFSSLSAQAQQHDSPVHTTLPPLQPPGNPAYHHFGNLSYSSAAHPQAVSAPHTPVSLPVPGTASPAIQSHLPASNHSANMMLSHSQQYAQPPYGLSQSMMYPSSTATTMAATNASVGLPTIQPRPPVGLGGLHSLANIAGAPPGHVGQQPPFLQNEEAPTHVVGSQGRRGILPSAPGRPNPPTQGAGPSSKSLIPQKDADGKFPCPHCNKTYLHAKHLKRHLLRHTGDRPYMCHLCKDTFSRSDILKRHFQKCSIRRGNPTGANHLAHQTQRRNTANGGRMSISQQDGPIGLAGIPEIAGTGYNGVDPNVNGDLSTRSSRANTLTTPGTMSHRNSVAGLGISPQNQPGSEQTVTSAAGQPGMPAYGITNPGNGPGAMQSAYAFNNPQMNGHVFSNDPQPMSFLGQQSSRFENSRTDSPHHANSHGDGSGHQIDWNRMFNQSGQDGFIGSQPANVSSQGINNMKTENDIKQQQQQQQQQQQTHPPPPHPPPQQQQQQQQQPFGVQNSMSNESFLGSLYSHPGAWSEYGETDQGITGFANWSSDDPWQAKVESLDHFCFSSGVGKGTPGAGLVKKYLNLEMVKHFAEHYTSYHGHWPFVHMPTFKFSDASDILAMAIICIGAIYSPRLTNTESREMMQFVREVILHSSYVYTSYASGNIAGLGTVSSHVEDLQALLMLHAMFTWHGEPKHRQMARADFPTLCNIAKCMDLCQTAPPSHYAYSPLHSIQANATIDPSTWDWHNWLEQEKRNRAMYHIFLTDAAMGLCFNCEAQFDPFEIRLMLPADDAAWEASDEEACAASLGLLGPQAQLRNVTGDRRVRQPGMREAVCTLMEPTASFQPGATNAYSKFILIHALVARIIACQKAASRPNGIFQSYNLTLGGSAPATPLSQSDWIEQRSVGTTASGETTPTDTSSSDTHHVAIQQERQRLAKALEKWKRTWDHDMDLQYPPGQTQLRRFGFCRDGVHFYYLARSFLRSQRPCDWTAAPDVRFTQSMGLLKRIKAFVMSDNQLKGQDIGSVSDIHEQYGVGDLTLDMKMLFRPFNERTDSPVAGVHTGAL